jgi:hypothetical protein
MARYKKYHKDDVDQDEKRMSDEPVEAYHGGYMSGHGLMGAEFLIPPMHIGEDPESGNPVPIGASDENVRDDIPAMISEGEYVLPADVVKWYGLKGIIELQNEARTGLMAMAADDLIQHIDTDADEEEFEDEYETEEGNLVEIADHMIEEGLEVFDDEDEDEFPTEVGRGAYRVTPKIAFIR